VQVHEGVVMVMESWWHLRVWCALRLWQADLDTAVLIDSDIVWLEITVDDPQRMDVLLLRERAGYLPRGPEGPGKISTGRGLRRDAETQ
jgi:hypothetical protein